MTVRPLGSRRPHFFLFPINLASPLTRLPSTANAQLNIQKKKNNINYSNNYSSNALLIYLEYYDEIN